MEVRVCPFPRSREWRGRNALAAILASLAFLGGFSTRAGAQTPRGGSPAAIPGTIQAEDFDDGGQGVAYYDLTFGNAGGAYRATDVDIAVTPKGGYTVGWTPAGEWLGYTVNVTSPGNYSFVARVASLGTGGTFHVEFNGQDKTGSLRVPNTGWWDTYQDLAATVYLDAGVQFMRIVFDSNGDSGAVGNLHFVRFEWASSGGASSSGGGGGTSAASGGTAWSIPGTVQAADFDSGGEGAAYHDTSGGNSGGAYRATDVDIAAVDGGYCVGWAMAGEWLRYTVNVTSGGAYTVSVRVASAGDGGTFHIEVGGQDVTGAMRIPNTGSWTSFQDVSANASIPGGLQSMRIVLDSNGATGAVGNFQFVHFEAGAAAVAPAPPPPDTGGSGGRLRVMTWNINFGHGDPWGQAQLIASSGADVALLQEASTFDEYMPNTYPDRLRALTGQTWYSLWSGGPSCGGGCQGTLILSRYPIADTATAMFDGTPVGRVLIYVGGVPVQLFNVHLEYYDTGRRTSQLLQFMAWTRNFGGPRIAGGDFNSWWDEYWIHQMETEYTDTWVDVTGSNENGYTLNGAVRFDYLFRAFDSNWRMIPTAAWVQGTGLSDHSPMIADYSIR
jgi:endonuclease/exonuclease/phosphatase family metal-dependent hydrolase